LLNPQHKFEHQVPHIKLYCLFVSKFFKVHNNTKLHILLQHSWYLKKNPCYSYLKKNPCYSSPAESDLFCNWCWQNISNI